MSDIGPIPPAHPFQDTGSPWPTNAAINYMREINAYIFQMDNGTFNEESRADLNNLANELASCEKDVPSSDPDMLNALKVVVANIPLLNGGGTITGVSPDLLAEQRTLVKSYMVVAMGDTKEHPAMPSGSNDSSELQTILQGWLSWSGTGQPPNFGDFQHDLTSLDPHDSDGEFSKQFLLTNSQFIFSPSGVDKDMINYCLDYC